DYYCQSYDSRGFVLF
nr:immunoglobulin light chain junction region [Macaca mulatta]MOY15956.1 immunoglobulin light chain junction region [Macaca mulatta]MOY16490.1 immunoglobulin light chain junction region [Macaca mulatta]